MLLLRCDIKNKDGLAFSLEILNDDVVSKTKTTKYSAARALSTVLQSGCHSHGKHGFGDTPVVTPDQFFTGNPFLKAPRIQLC